MEANKRIIPDLDELKQKLTDASTEHEGNRYLRASVAAKIIGISPSLGVHWAKRGFVNALRFKVPSQRGAVRGVVVAWPLDETIKTALHYWSGKRKWTSRDDDELLERLGRVPIAQLAKEMGRSVRALQQRAQLLDVNQVNAQGEWTTGEVARLMGVNYNRVVGWCTRTRGPLKHRRLKNQPRTRLINEDQLRDFLTSNPALYIGLEDEAKNRVDRHLLKLHDRRKAVGV